MEFEDLKERYVDKLDLKSAFTGYIKGDKPLLEELGIDLGLIKKESCLIFKIFSPSFNCVVSSDVTGPLFNIILFSIFLLLNYKVHFRYIYSISLFSVLSTFLLLKVMDLSNIKILECCSVLGYSFTPLVMFSFINLFINKMKITYKIILGIIFALWSAYTASLVFVRHINVRNKQVLILYPLFITYVCFSIIVVF
ncbi:protein transport protein YIP1 [Vairimorpha necatrix]|uniref:Protein YIP n=1 Tax=Vairimorpha necatrix TaxID=6039 RepID=A0AAX4JG57_9MICR